MNFPFSYCQKILHFRYIFYANCVLFGLRHGALQHFMQINWHLLSQRQISLDSHLNLYSPYCLFLFLFFLPFFLYLLKIYQCHRLAGPSINFVLSQDLFRRPKIRNKSNSIEDRRNSYRFNFQPKNMQKFHFKMYILFSIDLRIS